VSHWLAGRRPRSPLPELIAEAFARRLGRPLSAAETGLAARRERARRGGPAGAKEAASCGDPKEDPLETLEILCKLAESGRETDQGGVYSLAELDDLHAWPADDLFQAPFRTAVGRGSSPSTSPRPVRWPRSSSTPTAYSEADTPRAALARYLAYDIAPRLRAPRVGIRANECFPRPRNSRICAVSCVSTTSRTR
jgi:hypothetical protein